MTVKALILCTAAVLTSGAPALAQSITVGQLDAAKAFAPGIDIPDALESEAWQGTSADRAARLLSEMPSDTAHPIIRAMLRRVVLSGLVPPTGADEAFERRRIMAAQELATPDEYARFVARNPTARAPALRADAYVARGDLASACDISDAVQQGRGDSYWIRLRAACHDLRDETAMADLARDILRDRDEETTLVIPSPREGFWVEAMALDAAALKTMMVELAGEPDPAPPAPTDDAQSAEPTVVEEQLVDTLRRAPEGAIEDGELSVDSLSGSIPLFAPNPELAPEVAPEPAAVPRFDLTEALADTSDQGTARLFILGTDGNAAAVSEFVTRATRTGLDPSRVLTRIPALLEPADMAGVNLPLFARHAIVTRDIGLIQALFSATEDEAVRERLALASDALGGGFDGRALGQGLENALNEDAPNAVSDVLIALALGSNLTESFEQELSGADQSSQTDMRWIAIDHAIDRRARAESLLRFSDKLAARNADDPWTLYRTIRGLRAVGFADTAGQLAAYEFLRDL
jgi:hypothetical protein